MTKSTKTIQGIDGWKNIKEKYSQSGLFDMAADLEEELDNDIKDMISQQATALIDMCLEAVDKPFKTGDGLEDDEEMEDSVQEAFARQEIRSRLHVIRKQI